MRLPHWLPSPSRNLRASSAVAQFSPNAFTRLFIINSLGGNCPHVIDKYTNYTYPCLPVGLSWQKRGVGRKIRHTLHTCHTAICHTFHTCMTKNCHTLNTCMTGNCHTFNTSHTDFRHQKRCQRTNFVARWAREEQGGDTNPSPHSTSLQDRRRGGKGRRSRRRVTGGGTTEILKRV
jgi:hypothetical protein